MTTTQNLIGFYYTALAVFIFCAIALVVPSGYSLGAGLLLFGGIYSLLRYPNLIKQLNKSDYWLFGIFAFFALVSIGSAIYHGGSIRLVDKPIRFLLAPIGLFLLIRFNHLQSVWWAGVITGAISTGVWAMIQKVGSGVERATGYTYVIQYGNLSMLLGLWCIAGLMWSTQKKQKRIWQSLLIIGAVFGILGSLLSGSRGGWVGLPLVLLVFYRAYADQIQKKTQLLIAVSIVVLSCIIYFTPSLNVQNRIHEAFTDVQTYFIDKNPNTSVGARFAMWSAATYLIQQRPLTGWGETGYPKALQELHRQNQIPEVVARYGHPHNEILNHFAKHGVLGLLALILVYILPFKLFGHGLNSPNLAQRSLATAGIVLSVTYFDFGLSQAFFSHNSGIMFYAFGAVFIWGLYRTKQPN